MMTMMMVVTDEISEVGRVRHLAKDVDIAHQCIDNGFTTQLPRVETFHDRRHTSRLCLDS